MIPKTENPSLTHNLNKQTGVNQKNNKATKTKKAPMIMRLVMHPFQYWLALQAELKDSLQWQKQYNQYINKYQ